MAPGLAALLVVVTTSVATGAQPERTRDCALGFLAWCVVDSEVQRQDAPTRLRLEVLVGHSLPTAYFVQERQACAAAGCTLHTAAPMLGVDALVRLWGNPLSDDWFDVGLAYVTLPVVAGLEGNTQGFEGEFGPVAPGDGTLTWAAVRPTLRRPSLFGLVKSKYLVSSFGVGLAFPVATGAGRTFTGSAAPGPTLGGRLGVQFPVTDSFWVGVATSYNVAWYGTAFSHVAYVGGLGVNLQWLLLPGR